MLKFKKLKLLRKDKNHLAILNLKKKARLRVKLIQKKVKVKTNILVVNREAHFKIPKIKI